MSSNVWTVLIYANGNNELEPEITEVVEKIKKENISDKFNIVVQLARADGGLVRRLRGRTNTEDKERWSGVRRYLINDKGTDEIENLGNINMADPKTLYNFLLWGLDNYPGDNVMVILSGHGAGFIGAMTDFTHEKPYIMSLDGLINVFYKLYEKTNKKIEMLLLDCCYMNLVEIWYEFSNIPFNPIKYIMVASDNVKIEGISYVFFIRYLQKEQEKHKETEEVLIDSIREFNKNEKIEDRLILVCLKKSNLEALKESLNNISKSIIQNNIDIKMELKNNILTEKYNPFINLVYLCYIMKLRLNSREYDVNRILNNLKEIVIFPQIEEFIKDINNGPALYMPDNLSEFNEFKQDYAKLSFSNNNYWVRVLEKGNKIISNDINFIKDYSILIHPIILKRKYVLSSILAEYDNISIKEAINILEELKWF